MTFVTPITRRGADKLTAFHNVINSLLCLKNFIAGEGIDQNDNIFLSNVNNKT